MSESFDAYYKWLGIPPEEQPPNYYRLLGIQLFEENVDVIRASAERQLVHLGTYKSGDHANLAKKLIQEVVSARDCLMNTDRRVKYDRELRNQFGSHRPDDPQATFVDPVAPAPPKPPEPPTAVEESKPTEVAATELGKDADDAMEEPPGEEIEEETSVSTNVALHKLFDAAEKKKGKRDKRRAGRDRADQTGETGGRGSVRGRETRAQQVPQAQRGSAQPGMESRTSREERRWFQRTGVLTFAIVGGVVAALVLLLCVALLGGGVEPGTLVFNWLADERHDVTLKIDGDDVDIPAEGPLRYECSPGEHTVTASRPRYNKVSQMVDLESGQERTVQIDWEPKAVVIVEWPASERGANTLELDGQITTLGILGAESDGDRVQFAVEPGRHRLEIARAANDPIVEVFTVFEGQQTVLSSDWTKEAQEQDPRLAIEMDPEVDPGIESDAAAKAAPPAIAASDASTTNDKPGLKPASKPQVGVGPSTQKKKPAIPKEKEPIVELPPARLSVPAEPERTKALAKIEDAFSTQLAQEQPHGRLALASRLVRQAEESDGAAERFVFLDQARRLAAEGGEPALALLAADRLAASFDIDDDFVRIATLTTACPHIRSPLRLATCVQMAATTARNATQVAAFDPLSELYAELLSAVRDSKDAALVRQVQADRQRMNHYRSLLTGSLEAETALATKADDAEANWKRGLYLCLVREDWPQAMAHLAKSNQSAIAKPAVALAEDFDDFGNQLALADAWWGMGEETNDETAAGMLREAARHWYRAALPRAAGVDLAKVRERLDAQRKVKPKGGFAIALNGLGGLAQMTPAKPTNQNVSSANGFATFAGKATIEYPLVPAAHYVHEIELALTAPQGSLKWRYGGWTGAEVNLSWVETRFVCRLYHYSGGGVSWLGQKEYQAGQRLRFTVYAWAGQYRLFRDGERTLGRDSVVQDLRFRVISGDKTRAVIHRCEFRPCTEADSQLLPTSLPIFGIECDAGQTALTLHERNVGLETEPSMKEQSAFVIEATGTPMQWIPAGKYLRTYGEDKPTTEVTISKGFWIGRYEVTQEEWMALAKSNPSRVTGSPYLPVDGVSYADAMQFCTMLSEREKRSRRLPSGYVYRLPTEAEWEHACRAGTASDFSVEPGDFWYRGTSRAQPHEVGLSKPNAFGVYDMHGNVSEWVLDAWLDWPSPPPGRLENPFQPPKSLEDLRTVRGGSWWQKPNGCSSLSRAKREWTGTAYRGFRVVLAPLYKPPRKR